MRLRSFGWSHLADMGEVLVEGAAEEDRAPGAPHFTAGPIEPEPRDGWDAFGWLHRDGHLVAGARQLVRLEGCSVLRHSLGRDRWHVLGPSGEVAAIESYHDGRWISRHIGETIQLDLGTSVGPCRVDVNLLSATPVTQTVHDPHVLVGHFWDANYCNMLFETASRFWVHDSTWRTEHLPVVWERRAPWMKEVAEWLCPQRAVPLVADHVRFDTLFVPSFYAQRSPPSYEAIHWLRALYEAPAETGGRKLYVTRHDADSRRVRNETELLALLTPLGFERISTTGMSVYEQRKLFREAGAVVAPHGSGCANLIFAGPDAKLLELVPASYPHHAFHYLVMWSGQWYGRIVVADVGASKDMTVDLDLVREGLREMA